MREEKIIKNMLISEVTSYISKTLNVNIPVTNT
jgi:hypothetical protein